MISVIPCNGKSTGQSLDYDTCEGIFEWIRGNCTDSYDGLHDIRMSGGQYTDSSSCLLYQLVLNGDGNTRWDTHAGPAEDVAGDASAAASILEVSSSPSVASNLAVRRSYCDTHTCAGAQCAPVNDDQPFVSTVLALYVDFCYAHHDKEMSSGIRGQYPIGQIEISGLSGGDVAGTVEVGSCVWAFDHIRDTCNMTTDGEHWYMKGGTWQDDESGYIYALYLNDDIMHEREVVRKSNLEPRWTDPVTDSKLVDPVSSKQAGPNAHTNSVQCANINNDPPDVSTVGGAYVHFCNMHQGERLAENVGGTYPIGQVAIQGLGGGDTTATVQADSCVAAFDNIRFACNMTIEGNYRCMKGGMWRDDTTGYIYSLRLNQDVLDKREQQVADMAQIIFSEPGRPTKHISLSGIGETTSLVEAAVEKPSLSAQCGMGHGSCDSQHVLAKAEYFCSLEAGDILLNQFSYTNEAGTQSIGYCSSYSQYFRLEYAACLDAFQIIIASCPDAALDGKMTCGSYTDPATYIVYESRPSGLNKQTRALGALSGDTPSGDRRSGCSDGLTVDPEAFLPQVDHFCTAFDGFVLPPGTNMSMTGGVSGNPQLSATFMALTDTQFNH